MNLKLQPTKTTFFKFYSTAIFTLTLAFGNIDSVSAQCIGPYLNYEGVKVGSPTTNVNGMTGLGWGFTGTTMTITSANARSGISSLTLTNATANTTASSSITTPVIDAPSEFTFYIKKNGTSIPTYTVDVSNDGGSTYTNIPTGSSTIFGVPVVANFSAITTAYAILPGTSPATLSAVFPHTTLGYKFRINLTNTITTVATATVVNLDDFSWKSSVLANAIVVPELGATTSCNAITVPATGSLTLYDNGGLSDNYSNGQNSTIVFSPTNPGDKVRVTFLTYAGEATNDVFYVYNGNSGTNMLTHNLVGMPATAAYTSTDSAGLITVKFVSSPSTNSTGFSIKVECIASFCAPPTSLNLTAGTTTATGGTFTWAGATATNYNLYFSTTNTAPIATTTPTISTATSPKVVNTLLGGLTYYGWVRSDCGAGSTSTWYGPVIFTTLCTPLVVPYLENFNGLNGPIPTCTSATDSSWSTNITNGNLFTTLTVPTTFFSQPVALDITKTYRLTYDYSSKNGSADFEVYYGNTNVAPTTFTVSNYVVGHTASPSINVDVVNFVPAATGTNYLGYSVTGYSSSGTFFNLDNIILEEETCFPPVTITNVDTAPPSYAKKIINWTASVPAPSNGYQYYVSTDPTEPPYSATPTGSTLAGVTTVTLTGLSSATTYYVWVRANCGGHLSVWSPNVTSFLTANNSSTAVEIDGVPASTTGCNFTFYDSNSTGNYANNESNLTHTFLSSGGFSLKVSFSSFVTEDSFDGLSIYLTDNTGAVVSQVLSGLPVGFNGTTCPANSFYGTHSPGTIYSAPGGGFKFVFSSDFSVRYAGWTASVTCVTVPKITSFTPTDNACATASSVVITGTSFTGATLVTIGGVSVPFTVNSNTQITITSLPTNIVSGVISVGNDDAVGYSIGTFTVNKAKPVTVGVSICQGAASAPLTTSSTCQGYDNAGTTLSGSWTAADPVTVRQNFSTNSSTCSYSSTTRNYNATTFQVNVSGLYFFTMTDNSAYDGMGYITTGAFTPGTCGGGTYVVGDDDSGVANEPVMSANLTAGVTYTLYSTTYEPLFGSDGGHVYDNYAWTISPPSGGQIMLFANTQMQWYTVATAGTSIFSGASFNPVGVSGSGLTDTNTPGTYTYYAACSSNATCRAATTFIINPKPVITITNSGGATCSTPSTVIMLTANTVTGASTFTWSSSVANTLFSNAAGTIPYIPGTNTASVYIKTAVNAVVTTNGTVTASGCTNTQTTNITIAATTWSGGAWDNGVPTSTMSAVIQDDYISTGDLSACSLVVDGADVEFLGGHTLTLQNGLSVASGTITFDNNASLVQVNNVTNTGNITYKRDTTPVFKYDYTYWSSPVNPQTLVGLSPQTMSDKYFSYNPSIDNWTYVPSFNLMNAGKGYIIRTPDVAPFNLSTSNVFHGSFYGMPNNGDILAPITGGANQLNLVGNPYPSAISADAFLSDVGNDPLLTGTLYFWTHNTPITANQYTGSDYAIWNYLGGTGTSAATNPGINNSVPNGKIASGEGFFVEGILSGTATFKNSMRIIGNNNQFFRMSSIPQAITESERHRIWVEIGNETGAYKQMLVGYVAGATNDIDRRYDSNMIDIGNPVVLYTIVDNKYLSIQGKPLPFDVSEIIPVGYRSGEASSYDIKLSQFDGLFASQNIYLEDKVLNVIHNLKNGAYHFVTESGTFDDRFVLRFTDTSLGLENPIFGSQSVIAFKNAQGLVVESAGNELNMVTIFDIRGRQLAQHKNIGAGQTLFNGLPETKQILMVKVVSENGATVTKKVIY